MDKELKNYFLKLGFEEDDIEVLVSMVPGLEIIDAERAFKNIYLVTSFGYPEDDIDGLIFTNPGFLCNDPAELVKKLQTIEDVESALKYDPFII